MRLACVYINDGEYGVKGDIGKIDDYTDVAEAYSLNPSDYGRSETVSWEEVVDGLDERALMATIHDEYWTENATPTNKVYVDPLDEDNYTHVAERDIVLSEDATLLADAQAEDLNGLVTDKYNEMNVDVLLNMRTTFGTEKSDSANAYYETWKLMIDRPDMFTASNLTADMEVLDTNGATLFSDGQSLDTIQDLGDYAARRKEIADEYGVWRMERIQAFRDERDAILA